ncbi:unnamed protein product [Caenorhabditis auriculariae]|uniref:Uncharacterized protein n=1 Tax=Caenorhabditis auriculariae TaxID=2777116 RepID=A0A8S1GYM9_9PELO|nr:unnamed protein product [Caenorhabditis auriculariae]
MGRDSDVWGAFLVTTLVASALVIPRIAQKRPEHVLFAALFTETPDGDRTLLQEVAPMKYSNCSTFLSFRTQKLTRATAKSRLPLEVLKVFKKHRLEIYNTHSSPFSKLFPKLFETAFKIDRRLCLLRNGLFFFSLNSLEIHPSIKVSSGLVETVSH